jgi:non-specific serine/threonine protein kinase
MGQVIAFALDEQPPQIEKPARPLPAQPQLTGREMQVAELISEGMQTKQIAAKLFISERTVETHVTNILNKLGLGSRLQLARWVTSLNEANAG